VPKSNNKPKIKATCFAKRFIFKDSTNYACQTQVLERHRTGSRIESAIALVFHPTEFGEPLGHPPDFPGCCLGRRPGINSRGRLKTIQLR
jgi:hypothetical protein